MSQKKNNDRFFKWFMIALYVVTGAILIYFFIDGFDYYRLPINQRLRHPDYGILKPGGFRSHGLGIIGSTMMLMLLLYSLRKRTRIFKNWGRMNRWLNVHIYFGIMGPLFVILHSTFKLSGLVAVSFWSMIAVAVSGFIGRFLYVQIPRNIVGVELSMEEANQFNLQLKSQIMRRYGLEEEEIASLEGLIGVRFKSASLFKTLILFLFTDILLFFRRRIILKKIRVGFKLPDEKIRQLINLTVQKAKFERRLFFWNQIHRIFHYWHVIHKPFAIIMFLVMFIHVGIAIWLGYTWV